MFDYESFVEAEWVLLGYRWGKWSENKGSCNKSRPEHGENPDLQRRSPKNAKETGLWYRFTPAKTVLIVFVCVSTKV